jgi:putative ABC transport system permease protein
VIGSGGALILTSSLRSQLYEVNLIDPLTFAGVALLLISAIAQASFLPARRAIQVDPATALRSE